MTGRFSAREPKWLTGVVLEIGIVSTCEETAREILPIVTKALFFVQGEVDPEKIFEPRSGDKKKFRASGGLGACSPGKF